MDAALRDCGKECRTMTESSGRLNKSKATIPSQSREEWAQERSKVEGCNDPMRGPLRAGRQRTPADTIVMLTCQFTEILGGAEKQCHSLSETLRRQGLNVVVLTSKLPRSQPLDEPFVRRFWTYSPPQLAGRYLPASIIWGSQALFWIWWHRRKIAILHCHQLRINAYVAAIANALLGIPTLMKPGVGGDLNDFNVVGQWKYGVGKGGARFIAKQIHRSRSNGISDRMRCAIMGHPGKAHFSHSQWRKNGSACPCYNWAARHTRGNGRTQTSLRVYWEVV